MIDAATFSTTFNALWRSHTPTCELFVRRLNLDGYERFDAPLDSKVAAGRRALVAEYAFSLFAEQAGTELTAVDEARRAEIVESAKRATAHRLKGYQTQGLDLSMEFSQDERGDIESIHQRLSRFFSPSRIRNVIVRPRFRGCGYIDESEGDVIYGRAIYEVKTVERPFRSADIRQLITYAALNFASNQFTISHVGLFNPRRGVFCELTLDDLASQISGRPASDLLWAITSSVSSGDISR